MRTLRAMAWALAVIALGAALSIAAAAEPAKTTAEPAKAAAPAKPAAKTAPAPAKDETAAITGRVAGEDGKPVAKATVRVLVVKDERARGRFGRARERDVPTALATGDDGTFRATVPARAKTRVRIEAKGFAPFNADDVPAGAALRVTLRKGFPVKGRAFDVEAKQPLPGATVVARDRGAEGFGPDAGTRVTTGDDGRFTIPDLPAGSIALEAWGPAHALTRIEDVLVKAPPKDDEAPRPAGPDLFLRPGGRLAGRVAASDGKPIPDAVVTLRPADAGIRMLMMTELPRPVTTDASGRYDVPGIPVGRFRIGASLKGYSDAQSGVVEIARGTDRGDLDLTLEASAALTFRLVDAEGKPATGVSVALAPSGEGRGRGRAAMRFGALDVPDDRIERGEDGKVVVRGLDVGTFTVSVRPDDGADIEKEDVKLRAGETADLGTLRIVAGNAIAGRVSDAAGEPIPGAEVDAFWLDGMQPRGRTVRSKSDGRYKIAGLGDKPVQSLSVSAKGYARAEKQTVAPRESNVDFTLQKTASVVGKVLLADGTPPVAFRVKAHREAEAAEGPFSTRRFMGREDDEDFSSPDGAFRIDDVPTGTVTIEVTASGKRPSRKSGIETVPEQVVDVGTIVLEDGRTLRGRVLDARDGTAVVGAAAVVNTSRGGMVVRIPGMDPGAGSAISGMDGAFEIGGLEGRAYTLTVQHPDFAPAEAAVDVAADEDPPEVTVRLSRGGTLTGTVRDASKRPVPEATIIAMRGMFGGDVNSATSGPDGRYTIERLAPGSYSVMRAPEDGAFLAGLNMKQATIEDGETTVLDFDETARHTVSGRVLKGKNVVPGATLLFFVGDPGFGGGSFKTAQSDAAGSYQVGLDQPGAYTVMVQSAGAFGRSTSIKIVVPESPTATIDLALKIGGISGRVTGPDGAPVPGAFVAARLEGSTDPATTGSGSMTEPDGTYAIEGIAPGTYRVTASAAGYAPAEGPPVAISEEAEGPVVDLRLERGSTLRGRVVDPGGSGIQGAMVFAARAGASEPSAGPATTDINGSFVLTVGEDSAYDLAAVATGFAPARATGVAVSGEGDPAVVLRATPGGRARVQVVASDGTPVAGAIVFVRPNPPFLGGSFISFLNRPAPTGPDGTTLLTALAPGSYDVVAQVGPKTATVQTAISEGGESAVRVTLP